MKIFISPGHYPEKSGAVNEQFELEEHQEAVKVVDALFQLPSTNNDYIMVPAGTLKKKIDFISGHGPCGLAVEIHFNACESKQGRGIETLYLTDDSKILAHSCQESLVNTLPLIDRGIKPRNDLYLLNQCPVPAVIIEVLFIDNAEDVQYLFFPRAHEIIARAIYQGIERYL